LFTVVVVAVWLLFAKDNLSSNTKNNISHQGICKTNGVVQSLILVVVVADDVVAVVVDDVDDVVIAANTFKL